MSSCCLFFHLPFLYYGIIKNNWPEFSNNEWNGDSSLALTFSITGENVSYPFETKKKCENGAINRCWI